MSEDDGWGSTVIGEREITENETREALLIRPARVRQPRHVALIAPVKWSTISPQS